MNEPWKQKKKSSKKGKGEHEDETKRDDGLSASSTLKRERSTQANAELPIDTKANAELPIDTKANAELPIDTKANAELQTNALDPKQKRSNYRQILHKVH